MKKGFIYLMVVLSFLSCSQDKKESKKISQAEKKVEVPAAEKTMLKEVQNFFRSVSGSLIDVESNREMIELGKELYFETAMSKNNKISCNSCHNLDTYGVDNEPTSPGHDGTRGERNSPTTYYAALHFKQFWDGRAETVEEQAIGPILNPIEHGMASEADVLKNLETAGYKEKFIKVFGDKGFTYKNVGTAIGAFEKTLMPRSRFDDYIDGDWTALNEQEKKGYETFSDLGCMQCHGGVALGGTMFRKIGDVEPYETEDLGRYNVTKKNRDKYKFKVPGLRNVEKTAPYFHDGSVKTLDKAIELMAWHQLGEKITKQEIADVKAFLSTLTAKELKY
jgi:cytochrome c peroxidase